MCEERPFFFLKASMTFFARGSSSSSGIGGMCDTVASLITCDISLLLMFHDSEPRRKRTRHTTCSGKSLSEILRVIRDTRRKPGQPLLLHPLPSPFQQL